MMTTTKISFIGDVHAKFDQIPEKFDGICVGDYGIGFGQPRQNIKYIRGNHDSPELCYLDHNYLGDYGIYKGWFFVSGAFSPDWKRRMVGRDLWENEELSYQMLQDAIDMHSEFRPTKIFSHDAPVSLHGYSSRTTTALERMLKNYRPDVWVYGHHHKSIDEKIDGTRFVCLNELEIKEIE